MEKDAGRGDKEEEAGLLRGASVYAKELNSIINIKNELCLYWSRFIILNQICIYLGRGILN